MDRFDLVVRGGRVVRGDGVRTLDVGVRDGTIAAVEPGLDGAATTVIDAAGKLVLPGLVDAHTHPVYADDMASMTRAAVAAGVTTVFPFVGAFPSWGFPKTTPSAVVADFIETHQSKSYCDFGVHAAFDAADDVAAEVPPLLRAGVMSFKFFMAYRARGMMVGDDELVRGMAAIGRGGGLAMVHAENGSGIEWLESASWHEPEVDSGEYIACHTSLFEAEAILRAIALADAVRCPLYIPHVTVQEGLTAARIGRAASSREVWLETCPHYLVLTNDEVVRRGALSKIAPPIRHERDNGVLWTAVADGGVDVIATDHCGRTRAMKSEGRNILQAPYGAEGVEHILQLVYTEGVLAGRLSLEQMVLSCSTKPAAIFGIGDRKGSIDPGKDADIVVFDPDAQETCSAAQHRGASDYCLYEGRQVTGKVVTSLLRGEVAFDGGVVSDSRGRFLPGNPVEARQQGDPHESAPTRHSTASSL